MIAKTGLTAGDLAMLCTEFPFDYETALPLTPATGVTLANLPYEFLGTPDDDHMPCYVLPGTKLPGIGMTHICLICRKSDPIPRNMTRTGVLFSYIAALRLIAPAPILIASHFEYGTPEDPFASATLLNLESMWQPDLSHRYSGKDLMCAGQLLDRIVQHLESSPDRLRHALLLFTHITNGYSRSYQMSVLGMYSAIEALFAPKGNYASTLGVRVGAYLADYSGGFDLSQWITTHYRDERHALSHGEWELSPDDSKATMRNRAFGILHEVLRLSILGFLSMDETELSLLGRSGTVLQRHVGSLKPAHGRFLVDQRMWLGKPGKDK